MHMPHSGAEYGNQNGVLVNSLQFSMHVGLFRVPLVAQWESQRDYPIQPPVNYWQPAQTGSLQTFKGLI